MDAPTPDPATSLGAALADLAFAQAHDQALVEIDLAAEARGEPVPDRAAATFAAWALRAVGAERVVELGAGAGALTWWLVGAVGDAGEVHAVCDPPSAVRLEAVLRRSGRFAPVTVHTTDAPDRGVSPDHLAELAGEFDAIVVRQVTPRLEEVWDQVVARLRTGGALLIGDVAPGGPPAGTAARAVREALEDPELWTTVVPIGTGWVAALKARSTPSGTA
ncbi:MAG: hypothetical protein WEB09_11045, partial [Nitriliruptor sp.]